MLDLDAGAKAGSYYTRLKPQAPDALLALIKGFRDDPRPAKIDLGVGVYRDGHGDTPVFAAVKAAEARLVEQQTSKAYLGPEGDAAFTRLLAPLVLGRAVDDGRLAGVQTPGGTGALRLAAELVARAAPSATVWVGTPTWPNHEPILQAARLAVARYTHFDVADQRLCFDETIAALSRARPGDVALLHACCHNPTGADFSPEQWRAVGRLLEVRGILPLIDLAYQGLGDGFEADAAGVRAIIETCGQALVAYSCDKSFGLYRERTGALFIAGTSARETDLAYGNVLALARANWSMPPDHGAAVVRAILESPELTADWRGELETMRQRLGHVRRQLADHALLGALARQKGMFAVLPLRTAQIDELRQLHGIYMAASGRINLAGLNDGNLGRFTTALAEVA